MAKNLTHYTKDDDNEQVVKSKASVKQNLPQINSTVVGKDSPINPNKVTQSTAKVLPRQTAESVPVSVSSLVGFTYNTVCPSVKLIPSYPSLL